jgi:hypothetical protein
MPVAASAAPEIANPNANPVTHRVRLEPVAFMMPSVLIGAAKIKFLRHPTVSIYRAMQGNRV